MTAQRIGYGRVSTRDQNTNDQEDALRASCDRVFVEKVTGTKVDRPQWREVQNVLRRGDTLVITRLDRLARSSKDLHDIAAYLQEKGVILEATEQKIDTGTPEGKMFYSILAAFAEFEHDLIVARTKDGLAAARARGRKGGRKAALSPKQVLAIKSMSAGGSTVTELAEAFSVSRPTIYRALEAN